MKRIVLVGVLGASVLMLSPSAWADSNARILAKKAYDRGLEAHKRGDSKEAAEEFARADSLAPSAIALQAALDSAIEADHVTLGAELLERAKREPPPPRLAESITAAHVKFQGRAGRVRVRCPTSARCLVKLDDKPVNVDTIVWTRTGQHTISVQVNGGDLQTKLVDVNAESVIDVSPSPVAQDPLAEQSVSPPAVSDTAPSKHREGTHVLPPVVFYGGVGLTVLLAGATTYFALATSSTHSDFAGAGCDHANATPCADLKSEGENRQGITNIALVSTALIGIATTVVGILFTDWKAPAFVFHARRGGAPWRIQF